MQTKNAEKNELNSSGQTLAPNMIREEKTSAWTPTAKGMSFVIIAMIEVLGKLQKKLNLIFARATGKEKVISKLLENCLPTLKSLYFILNLKNHLKIFTRMIHVRAYLLGGEMVPKRRHDRFLHFYIYIFMIARYPCCRQGRLSLVCLGSEGKQNHKYRYKNVRGGHDTF